MKIIDDFGKEKNFRTRKLKILQGLELIIVHTVSRLLYLVQIATNNND